MNNFKLANRPQIYFGEDQISNIKEQCEDFQRILLVYGKNSIYKLGILEQLERFLPTKNLFHMKGISPNPRLSEVETAVELCKEHQIELIIAIGGGSVIDASKAIAIGAVNSSDVWDLLTNKATYKKALPIGTILTMVATGSETNDIGVVLNDKINLKRAFRNPLICPKFAIIDPTYTLSLNQNQTKYGLIDTMSHLFEQYMNNKDFPTFDAIIVTLFKRLIEVSKLLVNDLENIHLRQEHILISYYGYNGDFRTILVGDWACHGLDYGLASLFDTTHGAGLSIFMPNWMKHIAQTNPQKIAKFGREIFDIVESDDSEAAAQTVIAFRKLLDELGGESSFSQLNVFPTNEQLAQMVEKAQFIKPLGNTYPLTETEILEIYKSCL